METLDESHEDTTLIARIQELVRENYVFPEVAERIAGALDDVAFDESDEPSTAAVLTERLQSVNGDGHLRVRHFPDGVPPREDPHAFLLDLMRDHGPGVSEVRRLEGNVGLMTIGPVILPGEYLAPVVSAAFTLLQGVTRLIIDLRGCLGGVPESVAMIVSHLTGDEPVHLQDLVARDGTVSQSWTTTYLAPKLAADVPVFVLTSSRTFSGGEELAYDLQAIGRATLVGETTGGGAHPREDFDLTGHLQLHVPTAQSINAVTGTNWEGVGVIPDLPCAADDALIRALGAGPLGS
ncbi:S41 family peptidase [Humibacter ginsenosidimutans]|uniref:S41 family peptidase n=1 Tax=Humibacter ginsenosidimutans TaxID=2599293 RepID=UPI00143D0ACF|nr:S41 family peptidase [Humibacter ginsenosidimutans]